MRPTHLWWFDDFPLRDVLAKRTGLPVTLHHDAAACALAEYRWGASAGVAALGYLTCGTGFGVGLVLGGRSVLRRGRTVAGNRARALSRRRARHVRQTGCFEGYASASALARIAQWRGPARLAAATPAQIAELAAQGDQDAAAIVALNAEAVGAACALLVDLLGLDAIVLGARPSIWVRRGFPQSTPPYNVRRLRNMPRAARFGARRLPTCKTSRGSPPRWKRRSRPDQRRLLPIALTYAPVGSA